MHLSKFLFKNVLCGLVCLVTMQGNTLWAQDIELLVIHGRVADDRNSALFKANIVDVGSRRGATSQKDGIFFLTLERRLTTLEISFIGYERKQVVIDSGMLNRTVNDTLKLNIRLVPSLVELDPVDIGARPGEELVHEDEDIRIIDFEFLGEELLLLVAGRGKNILKWVDEEDDVLFELGLPSNTIRLLRGCFGNLHVLSDDSVYQITSNDWGLEIRDTNPLKAFKEYLDPCRAIDDRQLYFRTYMYAGQKVIYLSFDRDTREKRVLISIINPDRISFAYAETMEIKSLEKQLEALTYMIYPLESNEFARDQRITISQTSNPTISTTRANDMLAHGIRTEIVRREDFLTHVVLYPTYNPLVKIRDTIWVFDHMGDYAYAFGDSGQVIKQLPIDYHLDPRWKNELIVDYEAQQVYARYVNGGFTSLARIDLQTGKTGTPLRLDRHVFPAHIRVRDGLAYYLYKEPGVSFEQLLYRQRLD